MITTPQQITSTQAIETATCSPRRVARRAFSKHLGSLNEHPEASTGVVRKDILKTKEGSPKGILRAQQWKQTDKQTNRHAKRASQAGKQGKRHAFGKQRNKCEIERMRRPYMDL